MSENKLPAEFKAKWVAALRSGEYKQGQGELWNEQNNCYCCLGVACVLSGVDKYSINKQEFIKAEPAVPALLVGDPDLNPLVKILAGMNDGDTYFVGNKRLYTFPEIADYIEANL